MGYNNPTVDELLDKARAVTKLDVAVEGGRIALNVGAKHLEVSVSVDVYGRRVVEEYLLHLVIERRLLLFPALATSRPSTLSATPNTPRVWPRNVASNRPVLNSYSRMVPSNLPLIGSRPSALSAVAQVPPVRPLQRRQQPPT